MADCNLVLYTQWLAYCNSNVENVVSFQPIEWSVIPLILQGNKMGMNAHVSNLFWIPLNAVQSCILCCDPNPFKHLCTNYLIKLM